MPATFFMGLQQLGPWNETLPISGVTSCHTSSCAPSTSLRTLAVMHVEHFNGSYAVGAAAAASAHLTIEGCHKLVQDPVDA